MLGVAKCARPDEERLKLARVNTPYSITLPGMGTAERYAMIRADLEVGGLSISEQDSRIAGLRVEDWTKRKT